MGGDAPPKAIWALGDFVDFMNDKLGLEMVEPNESEYWNNGDEFWGKVEAIVTTIDNREQTINLKD